MATNTKANHGHSRDRCARQDRIYAWAQQAFTVEQATSLPQRGLRLLEEAIEAFQAVKGDQQQAHQLVDYVFSRPAGVLHQELGGVSVTLLALTAAAGLCADEEEAREVTRVLAKPIEEFTRRNAAKNEAGFLASPAADPASALTAREQQVMEMLARGMTNREIAEHLEISMKTVDSHRGHVLKKLGLRNNSELTLFAVKHGYTAL